MLETVREPSWTTPHLLVPTLTRRPRILQAGGRARFPRIDGRSALHGKPRHDAEHVDGTVARRYGHGRRHGMLKTARSRPLTDGRSLLTKATLRVQLAAPIWSQHSLVSSEDEGARVGVGSTRAPGFTASRYQHAHPPAFILSYSALISSTPASLSRCWKFGHSASRSILPRTTLK